MLKRRIILFAGTTEGRLIAELLSRLKVDSRVCVTSEYGAQLLPEHSCIRVSQAPLEKMEMEQLIRDENPEAVIDATHPYAVNVTGNIKEACKTDGVNYIRVIREEPTGETKGAVYTDSLEEAIEYLKHRDGNILLTTGSKYINAFTVLPGYQERVYGRVIPAVESITASTGCGIPASHLICMQGPFSVEMNQALIRQFNIKYLVTKESGATGGFPEKLAAAEDCGITAVIIGRPERETGLTVTRLAQQLTEWYPQAEEPEERLISIVGIGMGNRRSLTAEAAEACETAQVIIGANRVAEAVANPRQTVYHAYKPKEIVAYLAEHPEYQKVAIVFSGDVGFYSGAKKLPDYLNQPCRIISGISSMAYFCNKIGKSWDDVKPLSLHGKQDCLVTALRLHGKVFALLGGGNTAAGQCRKLVQYGLGSCQVVIGENLSYDTEVIHQGQAAEFDDLQTDKLAVLYAEYPDYAGAQQNSGIPDSLFIRGEVPMTKEEIRSIAVAKLRLTSDAVLYDIGAGTGSVAVEAALQMEHGMVYAVERNPQAIALIEQNRIKFLTDNIEVITGEAPGALSDLPIPSHVFIGGSSGNLRDILTLVLAKNPAVRIVITAITLETIGQVMDCIHSLSILDKDIVHVAAGKAKQAGPYHLMQGMNPVYIISFTGGR